MRILSWNINGIRANKRDLKELFESLHADVICLQETKVTRDQLDEPTAIVEGYSSYFSFSRKRSGYSGVANFCRESATPFSAEEGLTCLLNQKDAGKIGCYGDVSHFSKDELEALDAEGRTVITQHKMRRTNGEEKNLAIINVYCPRVDPEREDRKVYKERFLALLQTRAEALLQSGSHVIILGDLNLNHKKIDNCDPVLEDWGTTPSRMWMNQILWEKGRDPEIDSVDGIEDFITPAVKGGLFVDTFRHLYPDQEEAYSNWCTLTSARETNYGRRLDYILCDADMAIDDLKDSWIMRDVNGSDHCPVKTEFTSSFLSAEKCPALCTKYMPEFSGKQQKLLSFFSKSSKQKPITSANDDSSRFSQTTDAKCSNVSDYNHSEEKLMKVTARGEKRRQDNNGEIPVLPAKIQKCGSKKSVATSKQSVLMNFFGKTGSKTQLSETKSSNINNREISVTEKPERESSSVENAKNLKANSVEAKNSYNNEELQSKSHESGDKKEAVVTKSSAQAWKNLLKGPPTAPLCKGHNEPCVLRTVKKDGPNKGKQFFVCCRGEGLSSNPEARCNFFKWVDKK